MPLLIPFLLSFFECKVFSHDLRNYRKYKAAHKANATNHTIDLVGIKGDFLQYLYSPDILPELIHRYISRIEIEKDGTPRIYINFRHSKKLNVLKIKPGVVVTIHGFIFSGCYHVRQLAFYLTSKINQY